MSLTVGQAIKFGGLAQGRLLSGEAHLDNVIERVSILEAPCNPEWDYRNCLFITAFYAHKGNLAGQLETIEMLARHGCAVLVFQLGVLDHLPDEVIHCAEELSLPVVEIPEVVTYPEVITPLVGAILEEKTYLLQRSEEIHRRLTDLSLSGGGLAAIAVELNDLLGLPVAITDAWGSLVAASPEHEAGNPLLSTLNKSVMRSDQGDGQPVFHPETGAWTMGFFSGQQHPSDGMILVRDTERKIDPLGLLAIEQASIIAALEMVKQRAVLETEQRLQRDFFKNLLGGQFLSPEDILSRARTLGWDLADKRVVALVSIGEVLKSPSQRARSQAPGGKITAERVAACLSATVKETSPQAILVEQSDHLIFLFPCEKDQPVSQVRHAMQVSAETILARMKVQGFIATISFGGFYTNVSDLKNSYSEAQMAQRISKSLAQQGSITWFDDVALYVLLERIAHQPETERWFESTLGKLAEYDRINHTDLVYTLEAYFDANQTLQQAAFNLFVHPKTLRYRLHRIEEILGTNPFSKDQQLNYYLATKLARLFPFSPQG